MAIEEYIKKVWFNMDSTAKDLNKGEENGGLIRLELRTDKTSKFLNDYWEALHEYINSDILMHTRARIEILEAIIRVLIDDYGVSPNQMRIVENRSRWLEGEDMIYVDVDMSVEPINHLVKSEEDSEKQKDNESFGPPIRTPMYDDFIMNI